MKTSWRVKKPERESLPVPAGMFDCSEQLIRILQARGISSPTEIEAFLHPHLSTLNSPFLLQDIVPAVMRIRQALESGQKIGIFSDSDLDGMTSLSLLVELFRRFKIEPFYRYLKNDETYGLTDEIIDEFHDRGVRLLITVDSGIRDIPQIARARDRGIDCIVTDHHEQDVVLPDAIIVNPRVNTCPYPFKSLAGVGVAFKLCHALLLSYLPSFNERYALIARSADDGTAHRVVVRNGIVESTAEHPTVEDAINAAGSDVTLVRGLGHAASGTERLYDFDEFLGAILARTQRSIDDLAARHAAYRRLGLPEVDFLVRLFNEVSLIGSEKVYEFLRSIIGFVAIGTIADVMPLVHENRVLVRWGIDELNRTAHAGLSILIGGGTVDAKRIGWEIAPMLNTPGRVGRTGLTAGFFLEQQAQPLGEIIAEIRELNEGRKRQIVGFFSAIMDDVTAGGAVINDRIVFIKSDAIPDGYAGLVASRVSEKLEKPVIIAVNTGKDGVYKGSGRLKGGGNFFAGVEPFSARFIRIGGHAQAFGFTIQGSDIDEVMRLINDAIETDLVERDVLIADIELPLTAITIAFIDELGVLEPCGNANEAPLFLTCGVKPAEFQRFGSGHGKYKLAGHDALEVVGWNRADEMHSLFAGGDPLDICYRLDRSTFRGVTIARMIMVDAAPADR